MEKEQNPLLEAFKNEVDLKYQLYSSLFLNLPYYHIEKQGILLSLFLKHCMEGYKNNQSPSEIIETFFATQEPIQDSNQALNQTTNEKTKQTRRNNLLFHFIQYTERQIVLFDALEDAAFSHINDTSGRGTLKHLTLKIAQNKQEDALKKRLEDFAVKVVLTAHPTQFYPPEVLGIIWDLVAAIQESNVEKINDYLKQLGKTPFLNEQKPTPYDEAKSLIWFLKHVFFDAFGQIVYDLKKQYPQINLQKNPILKMGFWPGGDRDGNPYVKADTTLKVANTLRTEILSCYYHDLRALKRRLTFKGIKEIVINLETKLFNNIFKPENTSPLTKEDILEPLNEIKTILQNDHNGLFLNLVKQLICKVEVFGVYFASIDIRQDSSIHRKVIQKLVEKAILPDGFFDFSEETQINWFTQKASHIRLPDFDESVLNDVKESMVAMQKIQTQNGEKGCHRYIISHSTSSLDVMRVYGLLLMSGWSQNSLNVDIVPLIESIKDLKNAQTILEGLYKNETYRQHLARRDNTQAVMLGFSDGSKDGGYLMGNWRIFRAKEIITKISKQYGITVLFFDGRGGAASRGGGKTHNFFASQGKNIANREIQLTIQGQTISSDFGTIDSARFNLEQLLHAGILTELSDQAHSFDPSEERILEALSEDSFIAYTALKEAPEFMDYLLEVSPLKYYNETNIASRPTKRGKGKITMNDLRAIPYVASWSQVKQNITGFYGVGTALEKAEKRGDLTLLKNLYQKSLFFKTLIDNCEMALKKSFQPLTAYLKEDEKFGRFWQLIDDEYHLSKTYLSKLTGNETLMSDYPVESHSIEIRESMVLPLITIQQYAMTKLRELEDISSHHEERKVYEKLVLRCSFGLINAGRNSA